MFPSRALPPEPYWIFIKRIPKRDLPWDHRRWTGRHDGGCVRVVPRPGRDRWLFVKLRWKATPRNKPRDVGCFRLDLRKLLVNDYLTEIDDDLVQIRLYHMWDGKIYLKRCMDWPGIPIGRY